MSDSASSPGHHQRRRSSVYRLLASDANGSSGYNTAADSSSSNSKRKSRVFEHYDDPAAAPFLQSSASTDNTAFGGGKRREAGGMARSSSLSVRLVPPSVQTQHHHTTYIEPPLDTSISFMSDDTLVNVEDGEESSNSSTQSGRASRRRFSSISNLEDGSRTGLLSSWQDNLHQHAPKWSLSGSPLLSSSSPNKATFSKLRIALISLFGLGAFLAWFFAQEASTAVKTHVMPKLSGLKTAQGLTHEAGPCNPFDRPGMLHINVTSPPENVWIPFASSCAPSTLSNALLPSADRAQDEELDDLSWLKDRTIAVIGDSVDRNHVRHFCEMANGRLEHIKSDHPASPPLLKDEHSQNFTTQSERGENLARPGVCHLERLNFTLISIFQYGLIHPEEYSTLSNFFFDDHFYPPYALEDRISHILQPLFDTYHRSKPDLVVFGSSFWDTAHWARWRLATGIGWMTSLPEQQVDEFARRLVDAFKMLQRHPLLNEAKTILWRTAHEPRLVERVPGDIVMFLDAVAEATIHAIQHPTTQNLPRWMSEEELQEPEMKDLGRKLRMDHAGRMMNGQRQYMLDELHPSPYPNGKIWSDILLYELKRVIQEGKQ